MMHCRIHMELPSEAQTVLLCRQTATAMLEDLAVDKQRAADIAMVLSEAAGNVIRHAYPRAVHVYHVTLTFFTDRIRLAVADEGCGFVRNTVPEPDAEQPGGRGLWLIEQLADTLSVSRLPNGGCLLEAEFLLPHPLLRHPPIRDDPSPPAPEEDLEAIPHLAGPYHA
jgi:anti-sigma regulatory factor (Ser/Thr protein kinase)